MQPIKLIKSTFYSENIIKQRLIDFLINAKQLSMGEKCLEFETCFAKYHDRKYSVLFNSGSSANLALIQSMLNLGIISKPQKMAFSAITWSTNLMPVIQLGLSPIPIDVEIESLNVSSRLLKQTLKLYPDIKAFFITNLLGFCDDLGVIKDICEANKIILLEDNCESFGTLYRGKKLGNFGFASTSSFFVGHHLSTVEGGIVCTDDYELYNMLKLVRAHGWDRSLDHNAQNKLRKKYEIDDFYNLYTFYDLAYNFRPTEITGFLGLEQLKHADEIIEKRFNNFKVLNEVAKTNEEIHALKVDNIERFSNFAFPVILKNKQNFSKYLNRFKKEGIEIRPIVGGNMAKQPFFKKYVNKEFNLPNSDRIHELGFYCPNNPELTREELMRIATLLHKNI